MAPYSGLLGAFGIKIDDLRFSEIKSFNTMILSMSIAPVVIYVVLSNDMVPQIWLNQFAFITRIEHCKLFTCENTRVISTTI